MKFISRIISAIKGEQFNISPDVPPLYLINLIIAKLSYLIYGNIRFLRLGLFFIHPKSKFKCSRRIKFGKNFSVDSDCYIDGLSENYLQFGKNVSIGRHTTIMGSGSLSLLGKGLIVGDNVGLGTHGFYGTSGGLFIGSNTIIGNYVSFHPQNHIYKNFPKLIRHQGVTEKGITIGENCWLGAKVTVLDGCDIGHSCIIGAGSVVLGKFPPYSVIAGVPAKLIKVYN